MGTLDVRPAKVDPMLLSHDVAGAGRPVVLLHSSVADRRMWEPQVPALADRFLVVWPDLRGFGDSPPEPGRFSDADDVIALLDHLGLESVAIVGASYGGRVALETAVTHPARVARLGLLCPAYHGLDQTPDAEVFEQREEQLIEAGDIDGAVELNVSTWLGPRASEETRGFVREMQAHTFEVQIQADKLDAPSDAIPVDVDPSDVRCPTLVVTGGLDLDYFRDVARHLEAGIPDSRLVEWSDVAHLPNLEDPERTAALLLDFLS